GEVATLLEKDPDAGCRAEAARVILQLGVATEEARAALVRMTGRGEPEAAPAKVALAVLEGNDVVDVLAGFDDDHAAIVLDTLVSGKQADGDHREALVRQLRRLLRRGTGAARLAAVSAAARMKASELLPEAAALLPTTLGPEVATRLV